MTETGRITLRSRPVAALLALSAAAFCYVSVETVPVGLLPLVSSGLRVPQSETGLLVSGYGFTVAVASIPLARLSARWPRRPLTLALMGVLVAATVASAIAPDYGLLFAARVVTALSQALFWAVVAPVAAGMFPVRVRARATSVVFTGASLGPMLGVPLGTWIGQQAGWRFTFLALAALALLASVVLVVAMPSTPVHHEHAERGTTPDAHQYAIVLATTALTVAGLFAAYTYTAVFITAVAGMSATVLGPLLVARGVADFGGTMAGGVLSDRRQLEAVSLPAALLALALAGMFLGGGQKVTVGAAVVLSGLAMGALTPALQNRVMQVAPGGTDIASAGNSVAYNVGITLGSSLGGLSLTHFGDRSVALVGALLAGLGTLAAVLTPMFAKQRTNRFGALMEGEASG